MKDREREILAQRELEKQRICWRLKIETIYSLQYLFFSHTDVTTIDTKKDIGTPKIYFK